MESTRRAFLGSVGVGVFGSRFVRAQSAAPAQLPAPVPVRRIKSTVLFKSPEGYPNAIAVAPDGLWIAEQKTDNAHLVDWNGKVLKTVKTESKNTSGMGFPYAVPRAHGVAVDGKAIWMVTGSDKGAGLIKYDAETGRTLETAQFDESDPDPHGLAMHNGALYSCDAGIHPGWPENKSATHGYIFRIDLL